jgi:hypothetical protein
MKVPVFFTAAVLALVAVFSGCASSEFGKPLTLNQTTSITDILTEPAKYDGKRVLVEGKINKVCEMMGCWVMIQGANDEKPIRFKVEDGVIVFPLSVNGKTARAEGVVSVKTLTVEEQIAQGKHHAEETGETFDESTVTGPKTSIQINGEGAIVK